MKNIQILKEIIEAVEKHSEFEVKNFDSNTAASKNDEEIPKKKKKNADKKKCVDCVNCYNDDKVDELKCCKGDKKIISEYTRATFCDDYHARQ